MRVACWIPKATNTHSEYEILFAFPLQQWLHERASILRCKYNACIVIRIKWCRTRPVTKLKSHSIQVESFKGYSATWRIEESSVQCDTIVTLVVPKRHRNAWQISDTACRPIHRPAPLSRFRSCVAKHQALLSVLQCLWNCTLCDVPLDLF